MSTVTSAVGTRTCGACTRPSDNKHFDCPPRMSDGRLFTDYRPRCDVNFWAAQRGSGSGSYAYRQHLIGNATSIIDGQRAAAYAIASCGPCVARFDQPGTMLPEKDVLSCDMRTCVRVPTNADGLGTGRDFGVPAALQAQQRQQLVGYKAQQDARATASANCCASAGARDSYYPVDGVVRGDGGGGGDRYSVPGGGAPLSGGDPSVAAW
jgi:hypothetical protein